MVTRAWNRLPSFVQEVLILPLLWGAVVGSVAHLLHLLVEAERPSIRAWVDMHSIAQSGIYEPFTDPWERRWLVIDHGDWVGVMTFGRDGQLVEWAKMPTSSCAVISR